MNHADIVIIGSGGGTKLALPAAAAGRRVVLVEADAFGGTCLNRGCIPSKMLIYPAEVATLARSATALGLAGLDRPRADFAAIVARIGATVAATSADQRRRHLGHPNLTLVAGHARFLADRTVAVGDAVYRAERLFIATGARPHIPAIPGLAGTPYLTSTDALRTTRLPGRLLVLGGGYIATELGFAYGAFGAAVELIARRGLLRHEDHEVAAEFARVFGRHHTVHTGIAVRRVDYDGRNFTVSGTDAAGAPFARTGDALLVATGITPNTDDLGLERTAVARTPEGFIAVDDRLRTAAPGVYAFGDCIGRHLYRHTANREGEYLLRTAILGAHDRPLDYGAVPRAVFSHPQIGAVGPTEAELRAAGVDCLVGRATYADSTPGEARLLDHGLAKILVDRATGRVRAAHIVGAEAATMVHLFVALIHRAGTLDDLLDLTFIHPALPEVARDAARDAARRR